MTRAAAWAVKNHLVSHLIETPDLITIFGFPFVVAILTAYFHPFDTGLHGRWHTVGSNLVRFQVSPFNPLDYQSRRFHWHGDALLMPSR